MACCAVAIFILSQIYVMIAAVRELVFGKTEAGRVQPAGAAAWRRGDTPAVVAGVSGRGWSKVMRFSPAATTAALCAGGASFAVLFALSRSPAALLGAQLICRRLLP